MSYAIPAFLPFFLAALFAAIAPVRFRYLLVLVPLVNGILIYLNADQRR